MAYLYAPRPSITELPVFFNVDGVVGANPAQNSREDVLLVQFVFEIIAQQPRASTRPEVVAACKPVKSTGVIDDSTINAIRVFQVDPKNKNVIVDGRVSPARNGYSYGGGAAFTIVDLNNALQDRFSDIWPRIDKVGSCPPEIRAMVKRTVAGE